MKIENDYTGWIHGKEYPSSVELCDCHERYQTTMSTDVEWVKREYYWIHYEILCMECEMVWVDSVYLVGQGKSIIIVQQPTGEEE